MQHLRWTFVAVMASSAQALADLELCLADGSQCWTVNDSQLDAVESLLDDKIDQIPLAMVAKRGQIFGVGEEKCEEQHPQHVWNAKEQICQTDGQIEYYYKKGALDCVNDYKWFEPDTHRCETDWDKCKYEEGEWDAKEYSCKKPKDEKNGVKSLSRKSKRSVRKTQTLSGTMVKKNAKRNGKLSTSTGNPQSFVSISTIGTRPQR